jgi:hypothetical protein
MSATQRGAGTARAWSRVRAALMSEPIGCVSSRLFFRPSSSTSSGRFSSYAPHPTRIT